MFPSHGKRARNVHGGFTLIELMIYVAITAMVVVALTYVMIAILASRSTTQNVSELQHNLRFTADKIVERVLAAQDIDRVRSRFGRDEGTLVLTMENAALTPLVFFLMEGQVMQRQGEGDPEPLTSPDIVISRFRFKDLGDGRIGVLIEGRDPHAGTGSNATMLLRTSVSLRP